MKEYKSIFVILIIFLGVSLLWVIVPSMLNIKSSKKQISLNERTIEIGSKNIINSYNFYRKIFKTELIEKNDSIIKFKLLELPECNYILNGELTRVHLCFASDDIKNIETILDKLQINYNKTDKNEITFFDPDSNYLKISPLN